jgi:hypothetical protein
MRSATYAVLILTFGLALAGCKSEAEKEMSDIMDKQKDILAVLKGVTDKESAKAADVKLKAIAKDMGEIFERMKKTNPSQDEQKRILGKYEAQKDQVSKDMQAEMQRIQAHPEWAMELTDGMMEIGTAAIKAQTLK